MLKSVVWNLDRAGLRISFLISFFFCTFGLSVAPPRYRRHCLEIYVAFSFLLSVDF